MIILLLFFLLPLFLYIILVICSWTAEIVYNKSSSSAASSAVSLSTTMTSLVKQYNFREEVVDISGIMIHSVIKEPTGVITHDDDVFVFIHGTGSSSVIFFDLMNQLPANVKCIAIDLPSFGISGDIDVDTYPTNEDMCIHYANIIGQTLQKMEILHKTTLVGYSLGGFISIHVAARYAIKNLFLISPAGILPTLGVWGYYWAIFFKLGLPSTIFNLPLISRIGINNIISKFFNDDSLLTTQFWLYYYSNPRNKGHQILQRAITITPCYSYWNTPTFPLLIELCKKIPTTVCFGLKDTICPSHIGSFLKYVSCGKIMIHNIRDANHNQCVNTAKMVKLLKSILTNQHKGTTSLTIHNPNNMTFHRCCKGYSYPSLTKTQNSIDQIYKYLLTNTT